MPNLADSSVRSTLSSSPSRSITETSEKESRPISSRKDSSGLNGRSAGALRAYSTTRIRDHRLDRPGRDTHSAIMFVEGPFGSKHFFPPTRSTPDAGHTSFNRLARAATTTPVTLTTTAMPTTRQPWKARRETSYRTLQKAV